MNQLYTEFGVKRKENIKTMAIRVLMILGIILGVLLVFMGRYFSIAGLILIALIVFMFPRLSVEYEYIFVDGQFDFDVITGQSKRKTALRVDLDQIEIIAPEGSHALDSYRNMQHEKKDFSSGDSNLKPYIMIANLENKKYWIVFEPNEKMLSMIKQKSPRKLSQY